MNNLLEIQSQIAVLQKQAEEIKAQEFTKIVQEIQAKMDAYGITTAHLDGTKGRLRKSTDMFAKITKQAPVKFRGTNGETWSGRGLMPRWLKAQVDAGRAKEDFAVAS